MTLPLIILAWIAKFICQLFKGSGKPKRKDWNKQLALYFVVLLPLSTLVIVGTLLTIAYFGIVYGIFPLIGLA